MVAHGQGGFVFLQDGMDDVRVNRPQVDTTAMHPGHPTNG
jgi:hypothetical protein